MDTREELKAVRLELGALAAVVECLLEGMDEERRDEVLERARLRAAVQEPDGPSALARYPFVGRMMRARA
jgi:hypothetical protein